jgi:hypothetical protein
LHIFHFRSSSIFFWFTLVSLSSMTRFQISGRCFFLWKRLGIWLVPRFFYVLPNDATNGNCDRL